MTPHGSLRVLLADDHAIVRRGVAQLLVDFGAASEVLEAETGREALASRSPFDVAMLDISLPDINGLDVLKRLKRDTPHLPVLMFSMYREDQYAVRALKAGASGYLSKTADPTLMIGAIRQVAAGRKYVSPETSAPKWPKRSRPRCRSTASACRTKHCPTANFRRCACSHPGND